MLAAELLARVVARLALVALETHDEQGREVTRRAGAVGAVAGVVAAALPGGGAPEAEVGFHEARVGGAPGAEGFAGEAEEAGEFFNGAFAHGCGGGVWVGEGGL